jgi:hypothetical protein
MDLIERYLNSIRWNLTGPKADDIVAELRDVIASRIEDREEALDRPLTGDETSALLRDFGHPLVVAGRYGTQQWLIGPEIFPFYFFALKIVLAIVGAVIVVSSVAQALFHQRGAMQALAQGFDGALWTLLGNAGLVTLIFVIIERTGWLSGYLSRWKPEQLPDLSDLKRKPKKMWESAFEVAAGVVVLLWWTGMIPTPFFHSNVRGLRIDPAPIWMQMYWPIFALLAAQLLANVVQWLRPRWQVLHAALAVAVAAGGVALLAYVYRAGEWVVAVSTGMAADKVAEIQESLNLALGIAILVVGVIWVLQALAALWRMWRVR